MKKNNFLTHIEKTVIMTVFLLTMVFSTLYAKSSSITTPDFAFPKTVEGDARNQLEKALQANRPVEALRAFMNLFIASGQISKENVPVLLSDLDSLCLKMPSPYRAVGRILEARIYEEIYLSRQYMFDNRTVSVGMNEENPELWDRNLFAKKIDGLLRLALEEKESASATPLSSIKDLVQANVSISSFTVYDFIVYQAIDLSSVFPQTGTIPFYPTESSQIDPVDYLDQLIALHEDYSEAKINAIIKKADYLQDNKRKDFIGMQINNCHVTKYLTPLLLYYYQNCLTQNSRDTVDAESELSRFYQFTDSVISHTDDKNVKKELSQLLQSIGTQSVSLTFPQLVCTNSMFDVGVQNTNMNEFYLLLIKSNSKEINHIPRNSIPKYFSIVEKKKIQTDRTIPFKSNSDFSFSVVTPGWYSIVVSRSGNLSDIMIEGKEFFPTFFEASDIDVIGLNNIYDESSNAGTDTLKTECFVVSALNSEPVEGASVLFEAPRSYYEKESKKETSFTNAEGLAVSAIKNANISSSYMGSEAKAWAQTTLQSRIKENTAIRLFPDRQIYRPGDTVNFFGIVFQNTQSNAALLNDKEITVFLKNANYENSDSLFLKSDVSGRIFGSFNIPQEGLLGSYSLWTEYGSYHFQVAEYKAPSFLISLSKTETDEGFIAFDGEVATYSGVNLANINVDYTIRYVPSHFFFGKNQREETFSSSVETDSEGKFHIKLPLSNLNLSDYRGTFIITASATDLAGETVVSDPVTFWLADSYRIQSDLPENVLVSDSLKLSVKVLDQSNFPLIKTLNYFIEDAEGKKIMDGEFESPVLNIDARLLPSGKYSFHFNLKDDPDVTLASEVVLYRLEDEMPPVTTALWVPQDRIIAGDKNVSLRYGSSYPGQYLLCIISDSKGNRDFQWIRSDGKNGTIEITSPENNERKFVSFATYRDHKFYTRTITVIPEVQTQKLEIVTETFRPTLSPGSEEHWKFRLSLGNENVKGYAYALLYDKSLEALSHLSWQTVLFYPYYQNFVRTMGNSTFSQINSFRSKFVSIPNWLPANISFHTYNYPLNPGSFSRYSMMRSAKYSSRASKAMADSNSEGLDIAVSEEMVEEEAYMEAPMAAMTGGNNLMADSNTGETGNLSEDLFRPIEMPVAFFKPNLTTDDNGDLELTFTTPNFNTTWNFILGAYTPKLETAELRLETVASKSIMVKLLAPRFIRTGDVISFTATVYNNSDEEKNISGIFEIFDPLNGKILGKAEHENIMINPSGNKVLSLDFTCPDSLNSICIRVLAKDGKNSDGEQAVIPVIPSSQPVIESHSFYISAGQEEYKMKLNNLKKDASITFKYCDNPLWYVLTALPPITSPESVTLTSNLNALFANCVGKGILEKHTNLRKGLLLICSGEAGDSMLISNLAKDASLKTVTLNNTPWVNNANSETLRLSKLSSLTDSISASEIIEGLWDNINNLQNPDGGWSWCKGMKSSRWITENFVQQIGYLKHSGYLPALKGMDKSIKDAVSFIEKEITTDYNSSKKNRDWIYASMSNYLYSRSFFPEIESSSSFDRIKHQALDYIEKNWKSMSLPNKANASVLLWRNGRKKVAEEILASLREYSSETPEKGVWFDNLESSWNGSGKLLTTAQILMAFSEITPQSPLIDGMRQWLLLQKQTQDWQEGAASIEVINALLTTGTSWSEENESPVIFIGNKEIGSTEIAALTGEITINLDSKDKNKTIAIKRHSPSPAWGGIISQYISPMTEVSEFAGDGLSIRKEFWKIVDTPEGEKAIGGDTFEIGDKVRVTLIVDCGRDMDFVALTDRRAACLEPSAQISGYTVTDGIGCYRETRNSSTNMYFEFLPRGRHIFSYECRISEEGGFSSGIATVQSLYYPLSVAHSNGMVIKVQ